MNLQDKISCPICGKPKTWVSENAARPFCSDRCKLLDLGEWASETRRIPVDPELSPEDFDDIADSDN